MNNVQFVKKSSNSKIGSIPCTTSSRNTCPDSCPLNNGNGCYAEAGYYTRMNWDKVTQGTRGTNYQGFLDSVTALPDNTLWRHNVAGDLQGNAPDTIDHNALESLVGANTGKRGFTYTHYPINADNLKAVQSANDKGFTINLSGNNIDHALELHKTGLPVASVVPIEHGSATRIINGVKFVTCPAVYKDNVQCKSCGLCQKKDRGFIVAFPAHGTSAKKADIIARG